MTLMEVPFNEDRRWMPRRLHHLQGRGRPRRGTYLSLKRLPEALRSFRTGIRVACDSFRMILGEPKIYVKTAERGRKRAQAYAFSAAIPDRI